MFDIRTIVAPFDFSDRCRAAAAQAVMLSRHHGAKLVFVHVIPYSSFEYASFEGGSYVGEAWPSENDVAVRLEKEIDALEAPAEEKSGWKQFVFKGDPPKKIEEFVKELHGPFIVMPTRGYGPFRRFILGSVTTKVLHDLDCPIMTGAHIESEPAFGASGYRSVAAAIDLREHSDAVLEWAAAFARSWNVSLTVIHAVNWLETAPVEEEYFSADLRERLIEGARKEAEEALRRVGCQAKLLVDLDSATRYVPQAALDAGVDILVIGRSLERGLLGRLRAHAYDLIRVSPVPVISV